VIRQLRRLRRPLPDGTGGAAALAVYAEASGDGFVLRPAADQGFEGVACVDDAARAAVLYCALWRERRAGWARAAAEELLAFVGYMQDGDGRFCNFVLDWDGTRNRTGAVSRPGGAPWTARALHALACGYAALGRRDCAERFDAGLRWLERPGLPLDLRAVGVLALLEHWAASREAAMADQALAWAERVADERVGEVLPDVPGDPRVHLWGHLQEAALARAGASLGRPDLVEAARASAERVLAPAALRGFDAPRTLPFDVSAAVAGLAAVAAATARPRYARLADLARRWFLGRNAAGRPVYDAARGLVHDGIDQGRVNPNAGAEANVEGANALLPWLRTGRDERRGGLCGPW
jgi:hypothetical protein